MAKRIDLTGQRFNRLEVISYAGTIGKPKRKEATWNCKCSCGTNVIVRAHSLRQGKTQSCGCLGKENWKELTQKNLLKMNRGCEAHGMSKSSLYFVWRAMKKRCQNKNDSDYVYYGARGIAVCERWLNSFANFLEDMGECPKGLTLDRIDNNGNYEPGNCHYVTQKEQARNRRSTRLEHHNGKTQCLKDWAKELNISYHVLLKNPERLGIYAYNNR